MFLATDEELKSYADGVAQSFVKWRINGTFINGCQNAPFKISYGITTGYYADTLCLGTPLRIGQTSIGYYFGDDQSVINSRVITFSKYLLDKINDSRYLDYFIANWICAYYGKDSNREFALLRLLDLVVGDYSSDCFQEVSISNGLIS